MTLQNEKVLNVEVSSTFEEEFPSLTRDKLPFNLHIYWSEDIEKYCLDKTRVKEVMDELLLMITIPVSVKQELFIQYQDRVNKYRGIIHKHILEKKKELGLK